MNPEIGLTAITFETVLLLYMQDDAAGHVPYIPSGLRKLLHPAFKVLHGRRPA